MKERFLLILVCLLTTACSLPLSDATTTPAREQKAEVAATQVASKEIAYQVGGESYTGFLAYDQNSTKPRPGVIVVHEWWGHNDYARSRALQLAEMGYVALALDMYGTGKLADHPDNAMAFMQEAIKDPAAVKARFLAAKSLLQEHEGTDANKIAAIGYCFGGGVVLNMARAGVDLDGVASFHGSLAPAMQAEPGSVKAKVLVLNGAADPMVPPEQVAAFKTEMKAVGVDYELIDYPGVVHSFTNPGATAVGVKFGMPLAYDAAADQDSWARLESFLQDLWSAN